MHSKHFTAYHQQHELLETHSILRKIVKKHQEHIEKNLGQENILLLYRIQDDTS